MSENDNQITPTDLVDGLLAGESPETVAGLQGLDPAELEAARRVRAVTRELRLAKIELPVDFEARLMERIRQDETLLEVLELGLTGFGQAFVELLNLLLSFLPPATEPQTSVA